MRYTLPDGNVVTESRTESILQAFKDDAPSRFGRVHDEASEDDWPNKWPRPSLMDNARTLVTGTFLARYASLMQLMNAKMTDGKAFGENSCCRAKSFCLTRQRSHSSVSRIFQNNSRSDSRCIRCCGVRLICIRR